MKAYISFFRIRFIYSLQYRAAAYAGIATQFAWGFMYIMLYETFYRSNPKAAPMEFSQLANYIWLQQAFLALFFAWFLDNDIMDMISSGNVAYELIRPLNIYNTWFVKNCATRLSKALLRCFPILIIAYFLPKPYKFSMPASSLSAGLFIISMFLSLIVVVAYCMLIYILTFFTISPVGVRIILVMVSDFFSGGLVPLPFLPDWLTRYIYLSPFAAMQNDPFLIYSGNLPLHEALSSIILQIVWAFVLILMGKVILSEALKHVVVQGG